MMRMAVRTYCRLASPQDAKSRIAARKKEIRFTLLILCEVILVSQGRLGRFVLVGEIALESRAKVDMPPPEAAHE
jgi:hypothetical protein